MADRFNIEDYGKRVAKAAADDVFKQMKPYHQQAKTQAKELSEIRNKLAILEPLADAFKRFMELLLGQSLNLHNLDQLQGAQKALGAFAKAYKKQAEPEEVTAAPPALNRAARSAPPAEREREDKPKKRV